MELIFESFQHFLDPDWIMKNGGLYLVLIILFIETGVFSDLPYLEILCSLFPEWSLHQSKNRTIPLVLSISIFPFGWYCL